MDLEPTQFEQAIEEIETGQAKPMTAEELESFYMQYNREDVSVSFLIMCEDDLEIKGILDQIKTYQRYTIYLQTPDGQKRKLECETILRSENKVVDTGIHNYFHMKSDRGEDVNAKIEALFNMSSGVLKVFISGLNQNLDFFPKIEKMIREDLVSCTEDKVTFVTQKFFEEKPKPLEVLGDPL